MEQPETGVVCPKSEYHVAVVGHGHGVLTGRQVELPVQQTLPVQVQGVLQVDLFHVPVGRPADTDDVEGVAVQVEGMTQVGLLY